MENPNLEKAKEFVKSGRKDEARQLLEAILREDKGNVTAWLWMSDVVEDDNQKRWCLENVLALDPENTPARQGLEILKERAPDASESIEPIRPTDVQEHPQKETIATAGTAAPPPVPETETAVEEAATPVQETPGKEIRFHSRYLTFFGGLLAGFGVLLVWEQVTRYTEAGKLVVSPARGFESTQGILVLIGAIALCVISLVHKTKPMRPASPYSILIGIILLIITFQKSGNYAANLLEYWAYRLGGAKFTDLQTGDGIYLSSLGLAIAILGAVGINPGLGRPDWTTYLAVGLQWIITVLFFWFGGFVGVGFSLLFGLSFGIYAIYSTMYVIQGSKQPIPAEE